MLPVTLPLDTPSLILESCEAFTGCTLIIKKNDCSRPGFQLVSQENWELLVVCLN